LGIKLFAGLPNSALIVSVFITMSDSIVKTAANIITTTLIGYSTKLEKPIADLISPQDFVELASLFDTKRINNQGLNKALEYLIENKGKKPSEVVKTLGLLQINDESQLKEYVSQAIAKNPKQVEEYKSGKVNVIGYLVGQCMQISNRSGNPAKFKEILEKELA
jgi:Asp-tRNA(Asn)/Glu-tRNA(Gln) amidotransferase B subunit